MQYTDVYLIVHKIYIKHMQCTIGSIMTIDGKFRAYHIATIIGLYYQSFLRDLSHSLP